jgi:hypothetical protein
MDAALSVSPVETSPTTPQQQGLASPIPSRSPRALRNEAADVRGAPQAQPVIAIEAVKVLRVSDPTPISGARQEGFELAETAKPAVQTSAPDVLAWAVPSQPAVTAGLRGRGGQQPSASTAKAVNAAVASSRTGTRRRKP